MSRELLALMAAGTAALALGVGSAAQTGVAPAAPAAEPPSVSVQVAGKAVFEGKGNCATCHGRDGGGTPLGPSLIDGEWLNISASLEEIASIVRDGVARPRKYPAPMPPMGGARLRPAEVEAVARYVLGLSPDAVPAR